MRDVRIGALLAANYLTCTPYDAEVRREGARIDRGKHVEGSCVAAGDDGGCDQRRQRRVISSRAVLGRKITF